MKTSLRILLAASLPALAAGLRAAPAAELWADQCASCHGEDGKAQTKQGKKLKIRDYSSATVQAELKDEEMLKAILEGVTENGKERMKSFKDEVSADEAKSLVAFVRGLKA